jgi:hypothetical protein
LLEEVKKELEKIEEEKTIFESVFGIYFNDKNIEIKIYLHPEISTNGIKLNDNEFEFLIKNIMINLLSFDTYIDKSKIIFSSYITKNETNKVFGITIESTEKIVINQG